jgi:hypothetical protein
MSRRHLRSVADLNEPGSRSDDLEQSFGLPYDKSALAMDESGTQAEVP